MKSLLLLLFYLKSLVSQEVVLPTPQDVAYQTREIVALTHFNMGTYYGDSDPSCNANNWKDSGNPKNFNPSLLNISNWVESYKNLGAKSGVLTAKHGCGFVLWPTQVIIPSTGKPYNYSQPYSSYANDIAKLYVDTLTANGLGAGFYYSIKNNYYLNIYEFQYDSDTLLPGQQNVTLEQYHDIAIAQLTELFSSYGNLTEFWFDGGTQNFSDEVKALIAKYQPQMIVWNGLQVTNSSIKWVGTESGLPTDLPLWSTGCSAGSGDPNSDVWCPTGCDTTLQDNDDWFYVNGIGVRSLATLIQVYHSTVGNNGVLEMDFAPDTTGNIHPDQAQRYKEFGDWIRSCYGKSIVSTNGILNNTNNGNLTLELSLANTNGMFDRIMIQEDVTYGQRIRSYSVSYSGSKIISGTGVGHKLILLLGKNITIDSSKSLELNINSWVGDSVYLMNFAVFNPCSNG